jgi:hypothetical protein
MNKKVVLIVGVLLVLIGAGVYLYSSKKSSSPAGITENQSGTTSPMSIKDLLGLGSSQKCTFSTTIENGTSEGTVYISEGKMRGDFSSNVEGNVNNSHIIIDGTTSYTWMDGQNTGYIMTYNPEETSSTATEAGSQNTQGPDLNQKSDYNCSSWVPDTSLFIKPSDINFVSLNDLIPSALPSAAAGTDTNTSQCSYCDSLSGDAQTQCKSALNCP